MSAGTDLGVDFDQVVKGIKPMAHLKCDICHPGVSDGNPVDANGNPIKSVCGVHLLNQDASWDQMECEPCTIIWGPHRLAHYGKGEFGE
jgi:hypothetical protein